VYEIYKSEEMRPITDQDWLEFGKQVPTQNYTIRKGDTLWGLSKVFFGNGQYWSKIWSLNGKITNPHLIYPGAVLSFMPGSATQAPRIEIQKEGSQLPGWSNESSVNKAMGKDVKTEIAVLQGAPDIPPPGYMGEPVKQLPASFVKSNLSSENFGREGINFDLKPGDISEGNYFPSSFVSDLQMRQLSPVAEVVEIELGQKKAGYGSMVYIDSSNELSIGKNLLVYRQGQKISGNGRRGSLIQVAGNVKVTEAITSGKYRAIITGSFFPISVGSGLFEKQIPKVSVSGGRPSSKKFKIFGGEAWNKRNLLGSGEVIFITGGADSGVKIGDLFGIYKNRKKRYKDSVISRTPVPTATIKVFDVQSNMSSAVIVSSREDVQIGDFTGSPTVSISGISEKERFDLDDIEAAVDPEGFSSGDSGALEDEDFEDLDLDEEDDEFLNSEEL